MNTNIISAQPQAALTFVPLFVSAYSQDVSEVMKARCEISKQGCVGK